MSFWNAVSHNDGYYYYIGGFGVYFATKIVDIKRRYDIGGGVTFAVFGDIYYEEADTRTYPNTVLQFCKTPKTDIH